MNKWFFFLITLVLFVAGLFLSSYTAASYLLSEKYVSPYTQEEIQTLTESGSMPIEEYMQLIENGEDPGIEDFERLPYEIQLIQVNSLMQRIVLLVLAIAIAILAFVVIKSDRIEFSYMSIGSMGDKINIAKLAIYFPLLIAVVMTAQKYPLSFAIGWSNTVIWTMVFLSIAIWIINIIYAIRNKKKTGKVKIKR